MSEVEDRDVVAQLLAEGQDEAAEASVDVEPDAVLHGEVRQRSDGVDRPVAVVARRPHDGDGLGVDVGVHPPGVDLGGDGVDRCHPQLDPEQVTGLVERGMRGLRFDHVGTADVALLGGPLAIGEHGVGDAARAPAGQQAGRFGSVHRLGMQEVERHGDDLGFELGGARTDVPLEGVDMGEPSERLGQEGIVLVIAAVHGARAFPRLPGGVLLGGHGLQGGEDLRSRRTLLGKRAVQVEPALVGECAHGTGSLPGGITLRGGACWLHGTRHR